MTADPARGAVLVTIDSLRSDAITPQNAPTLSRLAGRAERFDRAFARGNWTPFSFPSLLGSRPVFWDSPDVGLPATPTLAEVLSEAGVTTAGFNAANGFLSEYWGYDRGFDRFESFVDDPDGRGSKYLAAHPTVHGWVQLLASPLRRTASRIRGSTGRPQVDVSHRRDVERRARQFLERVGSPFFLWVHYMDVHTPYVPAPEHVRAVGAPRMNLLRRLRAHVHAGLGRELDADTLSALRSLYDGAVHEVDASVGRLLEAIEASGRRESTVVVVAGDHGEEFQEHGHLAHYPKLYDELVRVPLLVDLPDARPRAVTEAVGLDAVPPTVCEALGVDASAFEGRSLLPAIRGGTPATDGPVTSIAVRGDRVTQQPIPRRLDDGEVLVSARNGRYTYVYHADSGRRELYDRRVDPGERRDLFESGAPSDRVVEPLHVAVERRLGRLVGETEPGPRGRRETPAAVDRQLAALGYR